MLNYIVGLVVGFVGLFLLQKLWAKTREYWPCLLRKHAYMGCLCCRCHKPKDTGHEWGEWTYRGVCLYQRRCKKCYIDAETEIRHQFIFDAEGKEKCVVCGELKYPEPIEIPNETTISEIDEEARRQMEELGDGRNGCGWGR